MNARLKVGSKNSNHEEDENKGSGLLKQFNFENLKQAFNLFDKDGDGMISAEEFKHIINAIDSNYEVADEDVNAVIKEISTSKNKKGLTLEDFETFMKEPIKTLNHIKPKNQTPSFRGLDLPSGTVSYISPERSGVSSVKVSSAANRKVSNTPLRKRRQSILSRLWRKGSSIFSTSNTLTSRKKKEPEIEREPKSKGIPQKKIDLTSSDLLKVFQTFDSNNDGEISVSEVQSLINRIGLGQFLSKSEVEDLFAMVDINHDNCISFPEFCKLVSVC
jgi:Ca2+-binding EF-hand superfamily protein